MFFFNVITKLFYYVNIGKKSLENYKNYFLHQEKEIIKNSMKTTYATAGFNDAESKKQTKITIFINRIVS